MNNQNIMSPEEQAAFLKSLMQGAHIEQNVMYVAPGASVNYYAAEKGKRKSEDCDKKSNPYFDTEEFQTGVARVSEWISQHNGWTWAQVYYFLRNKGLEEMPKTRFGEFIHKHGGPSARTVYNSGRYDLTVSQQNNAKELFTRVETFFPNI